MPIQGCPMKRRQPLIALSIGVNPLLQTSLNFLSIAS